MAKHADAALIAACAAARAATAEFLETTKQGDLDEPQDAAIERESVAVIAVAAIRPRTVRGFAEKAALLADYQDATNGCEPGPEAVSLALALAEDAVALVRRMIGGSAVVNRWSL